MGTERNKDGTFGKGNKGKPKGAKSERLKQWDELGESITGMQSEKFNNFLNELWEGPKEKKMAAAELYLKTLEYFKPKLSRANVDLDGKLDFKGIKPLEWIDGKD